MADSDHFENPDVTLTALDNFHRSSSVKPYHHPEIIGTCAESNPGEKCSFEVITITENIYEKETDFTKLARFQVSAKEHQAKLKSRQFLRLNAGEANATFE